MRYGIGLLRFLDIHHKTGLAYQDVINAAAMIEGNPVLILPVELKNSMDIK